MMPPLAVVVFLTLSPGIALPFVFSMLAHWFFISESAQPGYLLRSYELATPSVAAARPVLDSVSAALTFPCLPHLSRRNRRHPRLRFAYRIDLGCETCVFGGSYIYPNPRRGVAPLSCKLTTHSIAHRLEFDLFSSTAALTRPADPRRLSVSYCS